MMLLPKPLKALAKKNGLSQRLIISPTTKRETLDNGHREPPK